MAEDGKLYIVITKDPSGAGGGNGETPPSPTPGREGLTNNERIDSYIFNEFANFEKQQLKQLVNYTVSNIGNFTGDYYAQRDIQHVLSVGGRILAIGGVTVVGAKIGGVLGGAVALNLAVAGIGLEVAYSETSKIVGNIKQNKEISMLREISGLSALTNGSR